ncbi:MAG: ACP S-malonyltransferase [Clostridiaceae bacterium]|nr:ACP S-malonyltransferase [Clostridiaceae bacterium]MBW4858924.1 ACP S-malonyltransferase [Clostridiaceae bacterium]MBW4869499.1 ACP S-malonyltransferase [Clostridiaceae bacterium]
MGKVAFVFPGQGAQFVGMGKDFYDNFSVSKKVFEAANESLGIDIKSICFEGTEEELVKTENTQPAILTTSVAILKALEERGISCDYTAGLSLGEYTALVEANALDFNETVNLVKNRGKYMQEAVPEGKGGMAAILGLEKSKILEAVKEARNYGVIDIANYNSPEQIVISGEVEPLKVAVSQSKELGAKKAVHLPVSAPFHSSLLESAGEKLKKDLENVKVNDLEKIVITNVDAKPLGDKEEVKSSLVRQVSNSVLWCDSIIYMLDNGVDTFVEIGPGKSLKGFIKRIAKPLNKEVNIFSVSNLSGFENVCDFFCKEV